MYCSEIDEVAYSQYDRCLFVETLNDWGWHGDPSAVPKWYTAKPRAEWLAHLLATDAGTDGQSRRGQTAGRIRSSKP